MSFWIQTGSPQTTNPDEFSAPGASASLKVPDLSMAIQTVFVMDTEDAFIVWNGVSLRLNYKYDLCVIMSELVEMLDVLIKLPAGEHLAAFGSNTFMVSWRLCWEEGKLWIEAGWGVVQANTHRLTEKIELGVEDFLCEWKGVLETVITALDQAGVSIENVEEAKEYESLKRVAASIPNYGRLYRNFCGDNEGDLLSPPITN